MSEPKQWYMACLDLEGKSVLVVGGGVVALEKVQGLLACGARVTVVAPRIEPGLRELDVEWLPRRYRRDDLESRFLVIAATSDTAVNTSVHEDAERRFLFCNVVDVPELCSLILPAVHRQGPIAVAVSTGGASPALAQRIRTQIGEGIGPEYAELALRAAGAAALGETEPADLRGPAEVLRAARRAGARLTVRLVGAGPGDPGLITARGLERIRACDVLVHDRLVSPELVAEAPGDALVIDRDSLDQARVNELLVAYGREGLDVVRLKGGDPFVFGRGGEEALALIRAGVEVEVVPGVSSFAAVPSAAGIPVTHRGVASQVTVVAGHDADVLDFAALAAARGTLVFFMALAQLPRIARRLVEHGKDPATPAAVIAEGTLPGQRVVHAPLAELATAAGELPSPALIIVGEVVALAAELAPAALEGVA